MKFLVTSLSYDGSESVKSIEPDLDSAIQFVKDNTILLLTSQFIIYSLEHPLTVRYLDNKIFID